MANAWDALRCAPGGSGASDTSSGGGRFGWSFFMISRGGSFCSAKTNRVCGFFWGF